MYTFLGRYVRRALMSTRQRKSVPAKRLRRTFCHTHIIAYVGRKQLIKGSEKLHPDIAILIMPHQQPLVWFIAEITRDPFFIIFLCFCCPIRHFLIGSDIDKTGCLATEGNRPESGTPFGECRRSADSVGASRDTGTTSYLAR